MLLRKLAAFREGKDNLGGGKREIAEVNILLNVFM